MIINVIKIKCFENSETKLKGICSLTLDQMIVIHEIKILQAEDHIFLAMPSRKTNTGTFMDVVHPINAETREKIEELVIELYNRMKNNGVQIQEFQYSDLNCESMLLQNSEAFKEIDSGVYSNFVDDDIRKEIRSWITE